MRKHFTQLLILSLFIISVSSGTTGLDSNSEKWAVCNQNFAVANTKLISEVTNPPLSTVNGVSYTNGATSAADNIEYRYNIGSGAGWPITLTKTINSNVASVDTSITLANSDIAPVVIGFMRGVLVIKQSKLGAIKFTAYAGSVSTPGTGFELSLPTTPAAISITDMKLTSAIEATNPTIIVFMKGNLASGTYQGFFTYSLTVGTSLTIGTYNNLGNTYTSISPAPTFSNVVGGENLFYDKGQTGNNFIKQYVATPNGYTSITSVIPTSSTDIVTFTRLDNYVSVLVLMKSDGTNVKLIAKQQYYATPSANIITFTAASTGKMFTDGVKNLVVVTSDRAVWVTPDPTVNLPALVSSATLDATADADLIAALQITFSLSTAFAFLPTKIVMYKVTPANTKPIMLMGQISLNTDLSSPSGAIELKVVAKCQCNSGIVFKRFTCFTSTLSCLATIANTFNDCS